MGILRFQLPSRNWLAPNVTHRLNIAGLDQVPWTRRVVWEGNELHVVRSVEDSGYIQVPWRSVEHGELMLSTATVSERERPYSLPIELARGILHRTLSQVSEWQRQGLTDIEPAIKTIRQASRMFAQAVVQPENEHSAGLAIQAIDLTLTACKSLAHRYAEQFTAERKAAGQMVTVFGSYLGSTEVPPIERKSFQEAFSVAFVPMTWRVAEPSAGTYQWEMADRQIRWCRQNGMTICAGPLAALNATHVPDWLYLWEQNSDQIAAYQTSYLESVVERYKGQVSLWHCAGGMNARAWLGLDEDARLQMYVQAIHTLRKMDADTPLLVSFDQPFGDYMSHEQAELPPWQFADAMIRAQMGVSAIGLELNMGYFPRGTSWRDLVTLSRALDRWGVFGVPLVMFLSIPSADAARDQDDSEIGIVADADLTMNTPRRQQVLGRDLIELLLAKRYIQGVVWRHWSDDRARQFPHSGLIGSDGESKPLLRDLIELRRECTS